MTHSPEPSANQPSPESTSREPLDPLACYLRAVQHPEAEVIFLLKTYMTHRDKVPAKLKEDFAGTAAIATQWVNYHDANSAVAVDLDRETVQWARRRATFVLPEHRLADLSIIQADVRLVEEPRVDVVAAMNFSIFEYHDRSSLLAYFKTARSSLLTDGVLVFDLFGGPSAMQPSTVSTPVPPPMHLGDEDDIARQFDAAGVPEHLTYHWEQRRYDALTSRIDCRIHFGIEDDIVARDAFVYDWRLWTIPELIELLDEAGFTGAAVWCDEVDPETGEGDGIYEPVDDLPDRNGWLVYIVAER